MLSRKKLREIFGYDMSESNKQPRRLFKRNEEYDGGRRVFHCDGFLVRWLNTVNFLWFEVS